jgi:hypothetical protein
MLRGSFNAVYRDCWGAPCCATLVFCVRHGITAAQVLLLLLIFVYWMI